MCEECIELDKTIAHYCKFLRQGFDTLTTDRIKEAVAVMERRKAALRCGSD